MAEVVPPITRSTGNRTPGLQWIFGFPSSFTYTLNPSSEVQTSGNPYLVKFTTEKKNLIEIDLTHGRLEKTLLYTFAFPHLPQKSQLSWDFIKTKTIGVTKKERIKMLKFSLTVFFCFYPRKKNEPDNIFNILPEKFTNWQRKKSWKEPEKKFVLEKKNSKIQPEKKSLCPRKIF